MDPRATRHWQWTLFGLFWLFIALVSCLQTYFVYRAEPQPLSRSGALEIGLLFSLMWVAFTPLIVWLGHRFPLERRSLIQHGLLHLAASLLVGAAHRVLFLITALRIPGTPQPKDAITLKLVADDVLVHIDAQALMYWVILILYAGLHYYRQYQEGLQRQAQLEARLAQSQLQALRMQLHPHFLFNTLNAISSMIHVNAEAADLMVVRLSEFLRLSLDNQGLQEVPLERELQFIERYLDIEKLRFEERLQVEFAISSETLNASVPNLILQPLVENAIRHGIAPALHPGRLVIGSRKEGDHLRLSVTDNGRGLPAANGTALHEGVGLGNTRARLRHLYGEAQSMALQNSLDGGTEAVLTLPFREAS